MQIADKLGAGVAKALLGRRRSPTTLPYVTGSIGLLGTKPSWTLMNECDTLLMVGSSFPYSEFLPEAGKARGVQIDIDGRMLNLRYPMELGLIGDAKATLEELIPLLDHKTDRGWRAEIEDDVARLVAADRGPRALQDADPINPQRVFWELTQAPARRRDHQRRLGLGRRTGSRATLKLKTRHDGLALGDPRDDGARRPYAIAAKFAHPDRPAIALVGDGAMQMNGMAELITVAKYYDRGRTRG